MTGLIVFGFGFTFWMALGAVIVILGASLDNYYTTGLFDRDQLGDLVKDIFVFDNFDDLFPLMLFWPVILLITVPKEYYHYRQSLPAASEVRL